MSPNMHRSTRSCGGRVSMIVAFALLGIAITACSEDDDSAAIAEIAGAFRADLGSEQITRQESRCFASALVEEFGPTEAANLVESGSGLTGVAEEQRGVVLAALNDCLPSATVAPGIVAEFYTSLGAKSEPDQDVVACVTEELDGRVGELLFERVSDEPPGLTVSLFNECVSGEVALELFTDRFESEGATPEQAQCTAEAVTSQLSLEEITRLGLAEGEMSSEIQDVITQAASGCL